MTIWSRVRLLLRVQLHVRLTLRDSKQINGSWSEARRTVPRPVTYWSQTRHDQCQSGHDQLLIDDRVDKFKLALEVYEQDFIRETFEKIKFFVADDSLVAAEVVANRGTNKK